MDLRLTQAELLGMMKDIHEICAKRQIQYSLTGGSLLGAVREKGFIPWDDDIDIMVDRKNYELLCEALRDHPLYRMGRGPWLQHIRPVEYHSQIEPYIDVFIMDHLPDGRWKAKLKILLLRSLQGMLKEKAEYAEFSAVYKVCIFLTHCLGRLFTRKFKLWLYDRVSQIGNKETAQFLSITNDSFGLLTKRHRADVMEAFELRPFGDTSLKITSKYHDYLATRYGPDYMTPPEESERISGQHKNRARVKDERIGI